jgi:hypothetical protein
MSSVERPRPARSTAVAKIRSTCFRTTGRSVDVSANQDRVGGLPRLRKALRAQLSDYVNAAMMAVPLDEE